MKKIGIASLYTNSKNYGGNLQAYALCFVLNNMGYDAKQICYQMSLGSRKESILRIIKDKRVIRTIIEHIKTITSRFNERKNGIDYKLSQLSDSFVTFRKSIPHTDIIYNPNTIFDCQQFDVYITGSDQVWNLWSSLSLSPFYWLLFVQKPKTKLSYAASVSMSEFPESLHSEIKTALSDFSGISVRENSDKKLIEQIIKSKEVSWMIDPTFLVSRKDWNNLSADNPYKNEKYLFAFLIGDNLEQRDTITKFAQENHLKIITIPYLLHHYRKCDLNFGDIQTCNVTPNLWISLIRDAQYVMTDSFHSCVFSLIFHTPFFVFKRSKDSDKRGMNSRINSLLSLFSCSDRLIPNVYDNRCFVDVSAINYDIVDDTIESEKRKAIRFLKESIEGK